MPRSTATVTEVEKLSTSTTTAISAATRAPTAPELSPSEIVLPEPITHRAGMYALAAPCASPCFGIARVRDDVGAEGAHSSKVVAHEIRLIAQERVDRAMPAHPFLSESELLSRIQAMPRDHGPHCSVSPTQTRTMTL